jgi:hypothetical protein
MGSGKKAYKNSSVETHKISIVKELMNKILENGAYSTINYERQMSKKSKNYNEFEKKLVTMGYRFKKYYGEKLQKQLFNYISQDKEFLDYLKSNDMELYTDIMDLMNHAE